MPIRTIRAFPSRSAGLSQDAYSSAVEDSLTDTKGAIDDINASASQYNVATSTTSSSSVLIGTGAKTFAVPAALGFVIGMTLRVANSSTNFMTGEVTSYIGTSLVMNITSVGGSGTFASWNISMAAVGANTATSVSATPGGIRAGTNVQTQLGELDTGKLSSAAGAVTDTNLNNVTTGSTVGSSFVIPVVTFTSKGRISSVTTAPVISNGTLINTTSGTSHDFLSIPSGAKKITLMLDAIGTSGSSNLLVQLGDSGGPENTGYTEANSSDYSGAINSTAGFILTRVISTTAIITGSITFHNITGNTWVASGNISFTDGTFGNVVASIAGKKTLSATLDRIRLTTVNGTDVFDAGLINILIE